jgi:HNH endonuclease
MMISQAGLLELLSYDPETGAFAWTDYAASRQTRRRAAGCLRPDGYRVIRLDGRCYRAHRLAWLYVHGTFPVALLDHVDMDRDNNRIANLRAADHSRNKANRLAPRSNTSGFKGVGRVKGSPRWAARIQVNYRNIHIGMFDTAEEAAAAYEATAKEFFGEFARVD